MVKYKFSNDGAVLTIFDGYTVLKSDFQKTLNQIKAIHGSASIFRRSDKSLKREWACHNLLHNIGYKTDRTRHVDLDNPCDRPEWVYNVLGFFVWPLIP